MYCRAYVLEHALVDHTERLRALFPSPGCAAHCRSIRDTTCLDLGAVADADEEREGLSKSRQGFDELAEPEDLLSARRFDQSAQG